MSHSPLLSIEAVEAIIDQASDHVPSLRHLSLTCTALQPRARYHLFSNICIRSIEQAQATPAFLDTHSWLPPLVKSISLLSGPSSHTSWYGAKNAPLLDVAPIQILSRLPNLRTWKLELAWSPLVVSNPWLSFHRSALSCYQRYGGRICNLDLSRVPFDDVSDFTGLVSAFTSIQSLTCSYVRFRIDSKHKPFVYRSGPSKLARSLNLKSLSIGDFVDNRATHYLLASSGATLSNLVLTMSPDAILGLEGHSSEKDVIDRIWLRQPSSVTLIIPCYDDFCRPRDPDADFSRLIRLTTNLLEHVERTQLAAMRIDFKLHSGGIALLGVCLAREHATFEACIALDESLASFPLGRISCSSFARWVRTGRAAFWSPTFERAFPKLSASGRISLATSREIPHPAGHEGRVRLIVPSPDDKWIATASDDGTIILWDAAGSTIMHEWLAHRGYSVLALAFSPDSPRLVSAGGKGGLTLWEVSSNGVQPRPAAFEGCTHTVNGCAWSPDGAWIASVSEYGKARVWDSLMFQEQYKVDPAVATLEGHGPTCLQFSPDSRYLAWGPLSGREGTYRYMVWNPARAEEQPRWLPSTPPQMLMTHGSPVGALSFNPESTRIVTVYGMPSSQGAFGVCVWDPATGTMLAVLSGHSQTITDVSFSPDGGSIMSASLDGSVKIWDAGSGTEIASFKYSTTPAPTVLKACYSPDGKFVATIANPSSTVQLWRTDNASCVAEFIGHRGADVSQVAFSPNGQFLASGDVNGMVVIHRFPDSLRY